MASEASHSVSSWAEDDSEHTKVQYFGRGRLGSDLMDESVGYHFAAVMVRIGRLLEQK